MNEKMIEAGYAVLIANTADYEPPQQEAFALALSAAFDVALGETEGTELTDPEIAMQEAAWKALPNGADITINDYNRAVRAGYRAALQALKGQTP